ncbi:hypothetical protein EBS_0705 [endosymbiont of unidentified scaly snail isolate Monju]|nr:hypothetical protein EBS_0705 [endosymbiont of unidentified scaly snail isolate Monju]
MTRRRSPTEKRWSSSAPARSSATARSTPSPRWLEPQPDPRGRLAPFFCLSTIIPCQLLAWLTDEPCASLPCKLPCIAPCRPVPDDRSSRSRLPKRRAGRVPGRSGPRLSCRSPGCRRGYVRCHSRRTGPPGWCIAPCLPMVRWPGPSNGRPSTRCWVSASGPEPGGVRPVYPVFQSRRVAEGIFIPVSS